MKILYCIQAYYPAVGGAEWCTKNVCENLVSEHRDEVTVFCSAGYNCEVFARGGRQMAPGLSNLNGVAVRRFQVNNPLGRWRYATARIAAALRLPHADRLRTFAAGPFLDGFEEALTKFDADVFAAGSLPYRHMFQAGSIARRLGRAFVVNPCYHSEDRFWFGGADQLALLRQADAYVANTHYEREFAAGLGVAREKIFVAGNGVNESDYHKIDGSAMREKLGIGDAPLVAFIGLHSRRKGVDVLIDAMRAVWQRMPEAHLLIAGGRTRYSQTIEGLIQRLPRHYSERVRILYDFREEDKPAILASIDVLAFPSKTESFGIVLLEAWASGKPVVAFAIPAVQSVVSDGIDGLLCPPHDAGAFGNALLDLLENRDRATEIGEAGREKVCTRFTWKHIAAEYRTAMEYALHRMNRANK